MGQQYVLPSVPDCLNPGHSDLYRKYTPDRYIVAIKCYGRFVIHTVIT